MKKTKKTAAKKPATQRRKSGSGQVILKMPPGGFNIRQPRAKTKSKKPPTPTPVPTPTPTPVKVVKSRRTWWLAIAALVLLLIALAVNVNMPPWLGSREKSASTTPPATAINDHPEATNLKVTSAEAEATKAKAAMQVAEGELADVTARLEKAETKSVLADAKAKATEGQLTDLKTRLGQSEARAVLVEENAKATEKQLAKIKIGLLSQPLVRTVVTMPPLIAVVTNDTPVLPQPQPQPVGVPTIQNKNEVVVNVTAPIPLLSPQLGQPYWMRKLW